MYVVKAAKRTFVKKNFTFNIYEIDYWKSLKYENVLLKNPTECVMDLD